MSTKRTFIILCIWAGVGCSSDPYLPKSTDMMVAIDVMSGPCGDKPDGFNLSEGDPSECAYDNACSLSGSRTVERVVCNGGLETPVTVELSDGCDRETDGQIVDEGDFDAGCAYETECAEVGTQSRISTVCRDGEATEVTETVEMAACARTTQDLVLNEGEYESDCTYESACSTSGGRAREVTTCENGRSITTMEITPFSECQRDTSSTTITQVRFSGVCNYVNQCSSTGTQLETVEVCQNGVLTTVVEEKLHPDCDRVTEGQAIASTPYTGDCSYENECAETGTRTRTVTICENDTPVERTESAEQDRCDRNREAYVVDRGEYGGPETCIYATPCANTGQQTRTKLVCRSGEVTEEIETRDGGACIRQTDDTVINYGQYPNGLASCEYENFCTKSGTKTRINEVCDNGLLTQLPETTVRQECERNDTAGLRENDGDPFGSCEYIDECATTGTLEQTYLLCVAGNPTPSIERVTHPDCNRQTEGNTGVTPYGNCIYEDTCDPTGERTRERWSCVNGERFAETEFISGQQLIDLDGDDRCADRNTDGDTVSVGEFEEMCIYASPCQTAGEKRRLNTKCQLTGSFPNYQVSEIQEEQTLFRDECDRVTTGNACDSGDNGCNCDANNDCACQ